MRSVSTTTVLVASVLVGSAHAGVFFWSTGQGHSIISLERNLHNSRVFHTGMQTDAIAVDRRNSRMFWTDGNRIFRANMDPFHLFNMQLVHNTSGVMDLQIHGSSLYWADAGAQAIRRSNLDGSGLTDLVTGVGAPFGLAVDEAGGRVYWSDYHAHTISVANLDGTGRTVLLSGLGQPRELAVDSARGFLFWADSSQGVIHRSDLSGNNILDLATGQPIATGLTLDMPRGEVFWTKLGDRTVWRMNYDGTGQTLIAQSPAGLRDVALIPSPGALSLLLGGGLLAWRRRRS